MNHSHPAVQWNATIYSFYLNILGIPHKYIELLHVNEKCMTLAERKKLNLFLKTRSNNASVRMNLLF